jgi:hypothetical protein
MDIQQYSQYWTKWFPYFGIFLAFIVLATVIFLWLIWRQLRVMNSTYRLQSALNMFDKVHSVESMQAHRNLYEEFCKDRKFELNTSNLSASLWEDITNAFRTFEQIGALVQQGIIDKEFIVSLQANVCIRLWIVLEDYIQEERRIRQNTYWAVRFEYVTVLCLKYFLEEENLSRKFAIYQPSNRTISKPYDANYLSEKLQQLETEVKAFGFDTTW